MMIVAEWDEGCRVAHSADPDTWRAWLPRRQLNTTLDSHLYLYLAS